MMFKCFKFIDDMMKQLNEANEMPTEDDAAMDSDEDTQDTDAEEDTPTEGGEEMSNDVTAEGDVEQDPSQIADAEVGTFVSPIAKANWANMMLKLLKNNKPDIIIPTQFETVTTDNADQIIEFVKSAGKITDDEFGDDLNNI